MKRTNAWLEEKLFELWETYFVDVPRKNSVVIKFGKRAKRQLGCIKWAEKTQNSILKILGDKSNVPEDDDRVSLILITKHFMDEAIPEQVVLATIAHEMCHYAHGFNSPLNQIYDHPHKGGVIRKELQSRGLGNLSRESNRWLKANWARYLRDIVARKS